jgi:hypothetical protein
MVWGMGINEIIKPNQEVFLDCVHGKKEMENNKVWSFLVGS